MLSLQAFMTDGRSPDDQSFMSQYRPDYSPNPLYYVEQIYGGGYDPSNPGLEAVSLQFQVVDNMISANTEPH